MAGLIVEGDQRYCAICGTDAEYRQGQWVLACCGTQKQEANVDVRQQLDNCDHAGEVLAWVADQLKDLALPAVIEVVRYLKHYHQRAHNLETRQPYGQALFLCQARLKGTPVDFCKIK